MGNLIGWILSIFKFHKLKIFVFIFSTFIFLVILFPYSESGYLLSRFVSEQTRGVMYFKTEKIEPSLIPLELVFKQSVFGSPWLKDLSVKDIRVKPVFMGANVGAQTQLGDIWGGQIRLQVQQKLLPVDTDWNQSFNLSAKQIQLGQVFQSLLTPFRLEGSLDLVSRLNVYSKKAASKGQFQVLGKTLHVPAMTLPSQLGPVDFPDLNFSKLNIRGSLKDQQLVVENLFLGDKKDAFFLKVAGVLDLNSQLQPGRYNLKVHLELNPSRPLPQSFSLLTGLIKKYQQGSQPIYLFKVAGRDLKSPPSLHALAQF